MNIFPSINYKTNLTWALIGALSTAFLAFKVMDERPACAIMLEKQNVFYIGVDNPIYIVARGVPSDQLVVTGQNLTVTKTGEDRYNVRATTVGPGSITVSAAGEQMVCSYRIKRIPDPVPLLGARHGSKVLGNGEFKAQQGISAVLGNFDFDAKCDVVGYKVNYTEKREDSVERINTGARFNTEVLDLINKAKPGDMYYFDEIKARCPGDATARTLGSLVFKIK